MSFVNLPYEELQRRFAEQQTELDSLKSQRRDRDATIDFLQRRVVSMQNAARAHEDDGGGNLQAGNLQALLEHREQQIRELEDHVAHARQEIHMCRSQGAMRDDETTQALRWQLQQQGLEVESLRANLDRCQGDMHMCRQQDAHKIAQLQHQLQLRDEQMHAMGAAMEDLENQYHSMEGCNHEDLQRITEHNHWLTDALQQANLRVEDLQLQLKDKEHEAGELAGDVRAMQQELFEIQQYQLREDQDAGFHGNDGMGLPASAVRSPKASFSSASVPSSRSSRAPLPQMLSSSDLASEPDVSRVVDMALSRGLQEREDTVLQLCHELLRLQNQIHGQISQQQRGSLSRDEQRGSLSRDERPLPVQQRGSFGREAWPREERSSSAMSWPAELPQEASPEGDYGEQDAQSPLEMTQLPPPWWEQMEKPPEQPRPKGPTTPKAAAPATPKASSPQSQKPASSAGSPKQQEARPKEARPKEARPKEARPKQQEARPEARPEGRPEARQEARPEARPEARSEARQEAAAPVEKAVPAVVPAAAEEAAEPLAEKEQPRQSGELEEPICEETAAGGGLLVSLNFFDKEDLKAKKAKQQRVVRKIEERRRLVTEKAKEKAKADDAKAAAAEAAPAPEPPQVLQQERRVLQSAEAGKSKVISSKGYTPRKGLSVETDAWDAWPINAAAPGDGVQPLPVVAPGDLTGNHENLQHGLSPTEESGVPSLHDRFASIRAEMKRRRSALGQMEQPFSWMNPGG